MTPPTVCFGYTELYPRERTAQEIFLNYGKTFHATHNITTEKLGASKAMVMDDKVRWGNLSSLCSYHDIA